MCKYIFTIISLFYFQQIGINFNMDDSFVAQKKSKWYAQSFNTEWLSSPEFQDWLEEVDGDRFSALCKTYDCIFKIHK